MKPNPFYVVVDKDGDVVQTFPENSTIDIMISFSERILINKNPQDAPYSLWLITSEGWFEQKRFCA